MKNSISRRLRVRAYMKKKLVSYIVAVGLCLGGVACTPAVDSQEITVYMPDGAPALALAGVMASDAPDDGVTYRIVNPIKIASTVTYQDSAKNADLCVLPVTDASSLLGEGDRYTLLGTLTHGNLYFISKTGEKIENLQTLVGKKVGVIQISKVPGLTFKTALHRAGLPFIELVQGVEFAEDKVNLVAMTGADAVGTMEVDCYLLAEPAVTAQAGKGYQIVGDLQALYGGEKGYPQAVLVGKKSLVEGKAEWVADFTEEVKNSTWVYSASGEEILSVLTEHLEDKSAGSSWKAPQLNQGVISRCGIRFAYAMEEKAEIEGFLTGLATVNPQATKLPSEGFYWKGTK